MAALWIIGGILLLLILLLLLRVGVHLRFGEQLELTVIAGPARIQLLPRPEKTETEQKTKQKKKAKGEAQEEKEPAKQREKLSLSFEDVRSALPYLWEGLKRALARTRRRMRIDPLRLSVVFAGEDPAAVAQTYGWASSAMWTLMPQLERLLKIPDPHIHLGTDFGAARTQIEGEAGVAFRIGDLLIIGLGFGIPLLKWLRNFYRRFFSQQFKRSCLPDGPKVGSVTLSPRGDWRMPSDAAAALWLAELEQIPLKG